MSKSFSGPYFSRIRTEYEDLLLKLLYSVRIRENMEQKKLHTWTLFKKSWNKAVVVSSKDLIRSSILSAIP